MSVGLLHLVCLSLLASAGAIVNHQRTAKVSVSTSPSGTNGSDTVSSAVVSAGRKYLIASFPDLRQVAFTILPDNVWYPLVTGDVLTPMALAVDSQNMRLFVADPGNNLVWKYRIYVRDDGLLATSGRPLAAVEKFKAHWLATNGVGDLYFTGHRQPEDNQTFNGSDSLWIMPSGSIALGQTFNPIDLYTRENSGAPDPKVNQISGVAIDTFGVYWGNQAGGKLNGALCKGAPYNGVVSQDAGNLETVNSAMDEVRGVTLTGNEVFWLSPEGVYGQSKYSDNQVQDASTGLLVAGSAANETWNPMSLVWDGNSLLYMINMDSNTEDTGVIYTVPAYGSPGQVFSKFADAPDSYGLAILNTRSSAGNSKSKKSTSSAALPGGLALTASISLAFSALSVHNY
mmetsp:Transcript_96380/g.171307  ORF Transcript_96380/g.171307 Transcript_96380/m.171307 type:complete len:400 (+) Transcript_96380:77-1276(+)|eukprot:CAMPEP_0197662816 /NCGR_PEP_ID=MMETSP1338-20131121/54865_1 /TAXON_ID=43686 ORGANISM="Pelagodinium beii, Strain RCC1491" /NCGR_SAMPLE_ID=MMETSP1338 /ASSEMBLY_ACC=CAM_ASM_000754 /LENGTH=399 /DNA_ID=CAMNT_0043240845 /DNA_START=73 /DNA_END=1272 /DNA_ORIENTATION=-